MIKIIKKILALFTIYYQFSLQLSKIQFQYLSFLSQLVWQALDIQGMKSTLPTSILCKTRPFLQTSSTRSWARGRLEQKSP